METPRRWVNILTRPRFATSKVVLAVRAPPARSLKFSLTQNCWWMAAIVAVLLLFGFAAGDASAQATRKKKNRPKSAPCRVGCQPSTTKPDVITSSPEDAATQKELSELARNLRNAAPGAYERLSASAAKHASGRRGTHAAWSVGYVDYHKHNVQHALGCS